MILYLSPLSEVLVLIFSVEAPHIGIKIPEEVNICEFRKVRGKLRLGCGVGSTRPCSSSIGLLSSLE